MGSGGRAWRSFPGLQARIEGTTWAGNWQSVTQSFRSQENENDWVQHAVRSDG